MLMVLGLIAGLVILPYMDLEENAISRAVDSAVSELNGLES